MSPEPMMKFDPNGSAPLLSYRLPDATSYPGRNYVRLDLPSNVFRPEVQMGDSGGDSLRPSGGGSAPFFAEGSGGSERFGVDPVLAELELPAGVGVRALVDGQLEFLAGSPVDASLADLRREDLVAMRDAGLRPAVVRSLTGRLTLMPVPPGGGSAGDNESPSSGGTASETRLEITIASPTPDEAVEGPVTGVDVPVTGSADVEVGLGMITDVDARLTGRSGRAVCRRV